MALERLRIESNGMTFEAIAAGPASGDLVLLLHGFPQGPSAWRRTLEWLGRRGFRAVAPAQRGYSPRASPRPVDAYVTGRLADDVLGMAAALGYSRFHLIGHDWGGAVAWLMAASEPRRVRTVTVVSTPHPRALGEALRRPAQMLRSSYMGFFQYPALPEAVLEAGDLIVLGLALRAMGLSASQWRRDRTLLRRVGLRGPLNWYRAAPRSGLQRVGRVAVPTLFVWGRNDPAMGREAAEGTAAHVSGSYTFAELDAGHWIPDRNAAELHELLKLHLPAASRRRR